MLWLLELLLGLESLLGLLELSLLGLSCWLLRLELGGICVELLLLLRLELLLLGLELEAGGWQLLASGLLSHWSRAPSRCWSLGRCWSPSSSRPLGNRAPSPSHRAGPWGRSLLRFGRKTSLLSDLRVKGSRLEASGTSGNVVALQDPESVLAGSVLHCDGLAIVVNVTVLTDPLSVSRHLLPGDGPVLLSVRRAKPPVSGIESLLLQDLGILAVLELGRGREGETRQDHRSEHCCCLSTPLARLKCGRRLLRRAASLLYRPHAQPRHAQDFPQNQTELHFSGAI